MNTIMKARIITLIFLSILLSRLLNAQEDVIVIPGGLDNAGKLETTINGDTTDSGERANPNRIYELQAGNFYIQHSPIRVHNPNGTLTIRGQEGGTKAIIIKQALNEVDIAKNEVNGSLSLQNIHYQGMQPNGHINYRFWELEGNNRTLTVENCFMENAFGMYFNLNPCLKGLKIIMKNNYWRDLFNHKERWEHRIFTAKVPIDSLIFENNTVTGGGLTLLIQHSLIKYAVVNHNTFINNHNYPFLNQYWKEMYFTNNLFVNGFMLGEDKVNIADGGQDPDKLLMGIVGVDTIMSSLKIQDEFLNDDGSLTEEVDSLNDIIYYTADNILTYSTELDDYYNGELNELYDAPASYLSGPNDPLKVFNTPAIWNNTRTEALVNDWENIISHNNHIYTIPLADLGLGTKPLSRDAADTYVKWMRFMYGDRSVVPPTSDEWIASGYHFGDYDPNTVPGIGTENGNGITRISDLIEDFSYTYDVASKSDGHSIGALHWTDEIDDFDSEASLAAIKEAYSNYDPSATSMEPDIVNKDQQYLGQNFPNPFSHSTNIQYKINEPGHVSLTIYDIQGKKIETLVNAYQPAGLHKITWNAPNSISRGTYFYKLHAPSSVNIKKMVLIR
jgi:hypothetical protein